MKNSRVIHFEDQGQDFLRWWIVGSEVIASWPFQGSTWGGQQTLNENFSVTGFVRLARSKKTGGQVITIKYPIIKVVEITDTISLCPTCGQTHDRGPINGGDSYRCLYCGQVRNGRLPTIRSIR